MDLTVNIEECNVGRWEPMSELQDMYTVYSHLVQQHN